MCSHKDRGTRRGHGIAQKILGKFGIIWDNTGEYRTWVDVPAQTRDKGTGQEPSRGHGIMWITGIEWNNTK